MKFIKTLFASFFSGCSKKKCSKVDVKKVDKILWLKLPEA